MQSITFNNPNPATGQAGTLLTTLWCQNVNDEISNVILNNGGTLDATNHSQLSTVIKNTYAPLSSPVFTGTPLVPDTNSSSNGRQIVNFESMQAYVSAGQLGYTPVHQGGGTGQLSNTIYIGWSGSDLLCTVDATDMGAFAFKDYVENGYLSLTGGNVTGNLTYNGTTVATKNDVNAAQTTTENWVSSNFLTDATWNNNVNQDVRTSASPTFQTLNIKNITFDAGGGNSSIYQDTNTPDVVIATNDGSWHYNVFAANGSVQLPGALTAGNVTSNGDVRVGQSGWLYTNTIGTYSGTLNVNAILQQEGQNVATQYWTDNQGFATTGWVQGQGYATTNWVGANYVSINSYSGDFGSSGNIWNFAYGNRCEPFQVTATDNMRVNFPQAFSSAPVAIMITPAENIDVDTAAYNWDASGFTIRVVNRGATNFSVIAFGPK